MCSELRRFLARVPALRSSLDLEAYKATVGRQMYAALVQILLGLAPFLRAERDQIVRTWMLKPLPDW